MLLTRMVGMFVEQLEPTIGDGDALLLGVVLAHLEALAGGCVDDVLHILLPQRAQDAEEELALRQLVGELLLGGEVLDERAPTWRPRRGSSRRAPGRRGCRGG